MAEVSQKRTANWRCIEVTDSSVLVVLRILKSICKGCQLINPYHLRSRQVSPTGDMSQLKY